MIDRRTLLSFLSGLAWLVWLLWPLRAADDDWAPLQQEDIYTGPNFGIVRIDWATGRVALELHADDGVLVRSAEIDLSRLSVG